MLDNYPKRQATAETLYKNSQTVALFNKPPFKVEAEMILWKAENDPQDKLAHIVMSLVVDAAELQVNDAAIVEIAPGATRAGVLRKVTMDWAALVEFLHDWDGTLATLAHIPFWVLDSFEVKLNGLPYPPQE